MSDWYMIGGQRAALDRLTLEVARLTRWRNLWRACARQLYRSLRAGTQLHVARGRELERLAAERDVSGYCRIEAAFCDGLPIRR